MRDLVIADSSLSDVLIPPWYTLDMAFGADENDFELIVPTSCGRLDVGQFLYYEGTEYGGVIDGRSFNSASSGSITYSGRTWHGILASSVLCPDKGADYLRYSGDLNAVVRMVIERQGLGDLFEVPTESLGVTASGQFDRYTDAYSALCKVAASKGCKIVLSAGGGKVRIAAEVASPIALDTDMCDLHVAEGQYTNHLVCLGSGELRNRVVVHLYSDAQGNVSTTRTFSGVEEIAATYDYNNAEADELRIKGTEELQQAFADACELTVADNLSLNVGDIVTASSVECGVKVQACVTKVIVKVSGGNAQTVSYEVGNLTRRG